jgi:CRISPR-associated protein Csx14
VPDSLKIALDPFNPGQFFACCGLFELMSIEEPGLLSRFMADPKTPRAASFQLDTTRGRSALKETLRRLHDAAAEFPNGTPEAPVRPAVINYENAKLEIDWWLDEFLDKTTNIKCWAGQVTTRRLFAELLPLLEIESTCGDIFQRPSLTNSSFGVDPRSAWNTLDLGYSPNEHHVSSTVFPAVEVLASIGLQYFRPDSRKRSAVHYSLWKDPLPASIARLAFTAPWDGMQAINYVFEICKRGQSKYFSFAKSAEQENTN